MGMRDTNTRLTICEVLRQINDSLQGDSFEEVRDMLALAEQMAKMMSAKLQEYNAKYDQDFWKDNSQYRENFFRAIQTYKVGSPDRAKRALERLTT